jgi:apolipoprotein N-acyltransferase
MTPLKRMKSPSAKSALIAAGSIFSGLCWYISNGLNGDYWYLLWVAPVPVLLISFISPGRTAFFIAFAAYLIGRLSWFSYLVSVATLIPAIIFTIALPLIFALIVTITRKVVVKTHSWSALFAFPVFFTAFEWLLITFSPDGTAASIAYSQSDFLPFIQIASVTGILGISFMVTFIPSALAVAWHFRKEKTKLVPLTIIAIILITSVFLYGSVRMNHATKADEVTVGLVALAEKLHKMGDLNFQDELQHTRNYASEISKLATQGASLAVLPERAINLDATTDSATIAILSNTARQNQIGIVGGYTNFRDETARNSAFVIDKNGNVGTDYDKAHLVTGLEDHFTPGNEIGLFTFQGFQAGTAICKDLDFPDYIRQYSVNEATFLCIPAWDFVVDDWLHSRMAILRGVENGFSEVRTARLGRLTISDPYGRVTAEVNCSNGEAATLVGQISLYRTDTFYTRHGDWFGVVIAIAAITFLLMILIKRKA